MHERPPGPEVALAPLVGAMRDQARAMGQVEPALVRARLADAYRDVGVVPPHPTEVDPVVGPLDLEGWRRLSLIAVVVRWGPLLPALLHAVDDDPLEHLRDRLVAVATACPALTVEVVGRSPVRAEELARRLLSALDARVEGEDPETSEERLRQLDYGALLRAAQGDPGR